MQRLLPPHNTESENAEWKGFTIDELRYRRAYLLARCELSKDQMMRAMGEAKQGLPLSGASHGIMGKILGSLNYLDYALIAFRIGSKLFKLTRHRR